MQIGFIGLGRIGRPMAQRLAKGGHDLLLCDIDRAAAAEFAAANGARSVPSPAEAVASSAAVVLSLPGPREAAEVMLGADGVLSAGRAGLLVIDTTTGSVAQSRDLARRSAAQGIDYLDAPVSIGGVDTVTVMAGGDGAAFARARPILDCLGSKVCLVGPSGSGMAVKLINQSVYVAYMAAFAEGLVLGEASGIALDILLDVLGTAAAGNPLIATKYDEIKGLMDRRFAIDSAVRYLGLAQEAFRDVDRATPVIDAAASSLQAAARRGVGAEDLIVARHRYLDARRAG